jgi:hypothetical protein
MIDTPPSGNAPVEAKFLERTWTGPQGLGEETTMWLRAFPSGTVVIEASDSGPFVEKMWGQDTYTWKLTLPAATFRALLPDLLAAAFSPDQKITSGQLMKACDRLGLKYHFDSW